jgi:hypothetical protein
VRPAAIWIIASVEMPRLKAVVDGLLAGILKDWPPH